MLRYTGKVPRGNGGVVETESMDAIGNRMQVSNGSSLETIGQRGASGTYQSHPEPELRSDLSLQDWRGTGLPHISAVLFT